MADEILGFFLELDLAVAQHPEHTLRDDRKAGKQVIEKQGDHLLDRQKPNSSAGQADEAMDRGRDQGQRLQALAVADPLELQNQAKAPIGDKREGMRRIDRQRRQHRKHVGHELLFEPDAIARPKTVGLDHRHARFVEQPAQRQPGDLLVAHQLAGAQANCVELLSGGQAVLARRLDAREILAF